MDVVFYSTASGNTRRFVKRLGMPAARIQNDGTLDGEVTGPFVLVCPTYNGRVPGPVSRFLASDAAHHMRGVAVSGSTNFGADYGAAGRIISSRHRVPLLHTFELFGLPEDRELLKEEMKAL